MTTIATLVVLGREVIVCILVLGIGLVIVLIRERLCRLRLFNSVVNVHHILVHNIVFLGPLLLGVL
jgi:hypothetical protein